MSSIQVYNNKLFSCAWQVSEDLDDTIIKTKKSWYFRWQFAASGLVATTSTYGICIAMRWQVVN
jgi:hypothetical protein